MIHATLEAVARPYFNADDQPPTLWTFHGERLGPFDALLRLASDPHRIFGAMEYKRRYGITARNVPDYRVSVSKVAELARFCWSRQAPAALAVQLDHDLGLVPINIVVRCDRVTWGRQDRGRAEVESAYCVPWREFQWLGIAGQPPRGPVNSAAAIAAAKRQTNTQREQVAPHYGDPFASL